MWYHIRVPYLISYLMLDYDVAGAGDDYCGFSVSADDRRTIWGLKQKSYGPHWGEILNGQGEWKRREPSVQGLREFWLRVDMYSHHANPTLALQALNVTVGFQHNPEIQPRLVPGENPLWIEAGDLDKGAKAGAEWIWQVKGKQQKSRLELKKPGRAGDTVKVEAECPSEIRMTGLRIRCE